MLAFLPSSSRGLRYLMRLQSPELLKRLERLQCEIEHQQYAEMVVAICFRSRPSRVDALSVRYPGRPSSLKWSNFTHLIPLYPYRGQVKDITRDKRRELERDSFSSYRSQMSTGIPAQLARQPACGGHDIVLVWSRYHAVGDTRPSMYRTQCDRDESRGVCVRLLPRQVEVPYARRGGCRMRA